MTLFPTSLVGSYPQPEWLIDRAKLAGRFPPRVRAKELWRPAPEFLAQAQDDATRVAIRAQEEAGLDIVTDGEIRRESYSNHFATALSGVDIDNPGEALDRSGHPNPVPRVVGDVVRSGPIERSDLEFLRAHTDRTVKITVPGPFTMSQQAQDDHYGDPRAVALAYADAVNQEVKDLFAAGADIVQLDEPYMQARPEPARAYGLEALNRALDGVEGTTAVHICFGYAAIIHDRPSGYSFLPELADCPADQISIETAQSNLDTSVLKHLPDKTIILGVIDLSEPAVETAQTVAERVRRALPYVDAERIVLAPDCGMKYLPRESADGKMRAMAARGPDPAGRLGEPCLPAGAPGPARCRGARGSAASTSASEPSGGLGPLGRRPSGSASGRPRSPGRPRSAARPPGRTGSARTARSAATSRSARSRPAGGARASTRILRRSRRRSTSRSPPPASTSRNVPPGVGLVAALGQPQRVDAVPAEADVGQPRLVQVDPQRHVVERRPEAGRARTPRRTAAPGPAPERAATASLRRADGLQQHAGDEHAEPGGPAGGDRAGVGRK